MNRRWFLKRLGLGSAAIAALPIVGSQSDEVEVTGEPGLQWYWKNNKLVGMKLDCREPGWNHQQRQVYLNGKLTKYAVAADSYYGWVEMYDEDFKTLIPHREEGRVEIHDFNT